VTSSKRASFCGRFLFEGFEGYQAGKMYFWMMDDDDDDDDYDDDDDDDDDEDDFDYDHDDDADGGSCTTKDRLLTGSSQVREISHCFNGGIHCEFCT